MSIKLCDPMSRGAWACLSISALVVLAIPLLMLDLETILSPPAIEPPAPIKCQSRHEPRFNGTLLNTDYIKVYENIYNKNLNSTRPKYVLLRLCDGTGFGNVMRTLYSLFILAMATERILVVDYSLLAVAFDPPDGISWDYIKFTGGVYPPNSVISDRFITSMPLGVKGIIPMSKDPPDEEWEKYLESDWIVFCRGHAFDLYMLMNPKLSPIIQRVFNMENEFATQNVRTVRHMLAQKIITYLLGNPSPRLMRDVNKLLTEIDFPPGYTSCYGGKPYPPRDPAVITVGARYRTIYNSRQEFLDCFPRMLNQTVKDVKHQRKIKHDTPAKVVIFLTTDDPTVHPEFREKFSGLGRIVSNPVYEPVETNHGQYSNKNWAESDDPMHPGLVDWFVLGEADIMYGSATTFLIFGAARTGVHMWDERDCAPSDKWYEFK